MRADTIVWAKFESVGKPEHTKLANGSVKQIMLELAPWLMSIYMGSKIRITLARTESELADSRRTTELADIQNDLAALLGDSPEQEKPVNA